MNKNNKIPVLNENLTFKELFEELDELEKLEKSNEKNIEKNLKE